MAKTIDEISGRINETFVIQSGHTEYSFKRATSVPFFSFTDMQKQIDDASLIITHGGYGAIHDCLQKGKKVVAVPRNSNEHNHDQNELVRVLEQAGCIMAVYDVDDLEKTIIQANEFVPKTLQKGNGIKIINQFIQNNAGK